GRDDKNSRRNRITSSDDREERNCCQSPLRFYTGGSDRGPEASMAHPAEETKSVGANRDCCDAWRLVHSGSLSFPRNASGPSQTVRTDCPQSLAHHRR